MSLTSIKLQLVDYTVVFIFFLFFTSFCQEIEGIILHPEKSCIAVICQLLGFTIFADNAVVSLIPCFILFGICFYEYGAIVSDLDSR